MALLFCQPRMTPTLPVCLAVLMSAAVRTGMMMSSCTSNHSSHWAILAMVWRKSCHTEQVQWTVVMPPFAMSSNSALEKRAITKPSIKIASL